MAYSEILEKIQNQLDYKYDIQTQTVSGYPNCISGIYRVESLNEGMFYIRHDNNEHLYIYVVAPYGREALKSSMVYKHMSEVNRKIGRGNFYVNEENSSLVFKLVYPVCYFQTDTEKRIDEFILMPMGMVKKYQEIFLL